MTTPYQPYPQVRFNLPMSGKVTGTAILLVRGDGTGQIRTEGAHVNDDNPAVDYRGESFLVHLEVVRDETGKVSLPDDGYRLGKYGSVTRRSNWSRSDAPVSFAMAIAEALVAEAQTRWTDEFEAEGLVAKTQQDLHYAEEEAAKATKVYTEAVQTLSAAQSAYRAALEAYVGGEVDA